MPRLARINGFYLPTGDKSDANTPITCTPVMKDVMKNFNKLSMTTTGVSVTTFSGNIHHLSKSPCAVSPMLKAMLSSAAKNNGYNTPIARDKENMGPFCVASADNRYGYNPRSLESSRNSSEVSLNNVSISKLMSAPLCQIDENAKKIRKKLF